jgi:hypothetical protein
MNIKNVVLITDSSSKDSGFYNIIFDDNSENQCSSEMNLELWNKANEWRQTNNAGYDFENMAKKMSNNILNQMEINYKQAQIVKVINGITFHYPINGESYSVFKDKVQEAQLLPDGCNINIKDINDISYSAKIPHNLMLMIYQKMDEISSENDRIKLILEVKLKIHAKDQNLTALEGLDVTNFQEDSEINLNKICDKILEDYPYDEYLNKIKFIKNGENRYHIFTRLIK